MRKTLTALLGACVLALPAPAASKDKPAEPAKKIADPGPVLAVRAGEPIEIDGALSEKAWQTGGYTRFVQNDPQDGGDPTEPTKVWVAYDDANLYVAAYLYDSAPASIKPLLGRRDDQLDSDWFFVSIDPYFDRRSGYQFGVNPAGSVADLVLSNDVNEDPTWDGVWEAKAQVNGQGWIVEMKIPFNQLRFPKQEEMVWGVNFQRTIIRKKERMSYVWIPKEDIAFVSRFARLEGIENIHPGRHIEVLPYGVGQAQFKPAEPGNPFQTGRKALGNAGFDLKVGLKSNLTLDATVNPDFGQVEVDPAVINLSAYETYYEEKRPFFIEGASLFNGFGRGGVYLNANINWPSPRFFYSRRIGRAPQGYVTGEGYTDIPDRSTILGAAKLTGQIGGGWNIGVISALTSREYADIDSVGVRSREEVEPFSAYGVLRAQKDFNKGQQGFGILATGVSRDLRSEALSGILNSGALSLALDGWAFLDSKRTWVVGGWFGGTRVEGSREDILRLQRSSTHYFQRPDADHVEVDPTATSLSGWGGRFALAKQQGKYLFLANAGVLSPGFDPNDAGFQSGGSDIINVSILPGIVWTKPGKVFRNAQLIGGPFRNYDFGGNKFWDGALVNFAAQLLNYWTFDFMVAYNPETISNRLTRGGPLAVVPPGYQFNLGLFSDNRKAVVLEGFITTYQRPTESFEWSAEFSLRWKPRSNFNLSFGPGYTYEDSQRQWVTRVADPLMTATYGTRYVFGRIKQQVLSSTVRLNWIFTPRLSLQLYLQPFIAVGEYDAFKELARPKSAEHNVYGQNGSTIVRDGEAYTVDPDGAGPAAPFTIWNPDFNVKSLRGTAVLRWEYRPGSLLYFVWTQNRADYAHPGDFQLRRDLGDLLTAPGDNIFLLKFSYRWSL